MIGIEPIWIAEDSAPKEPALEPLPFFCLEARRSRFVSKRQGNEFPIERYCAVVIALLAATCGLNAASLSKAVWQADRGLPDNHVHDIQQTRDGFLWLGTDGGLVRFDGANFKRAPSQVKSEQLGPRVYRLHEDRTGKLWVSLYNSKVAYYQEGELHLPAGIAAPTGEQVGSICEDAEGTVLISWRGGRVDQFRNGTMGRAADFPVIESRTPPILAVELDGQRVWYAHEKVLGFRENGRFNQLPELDNATKLLVPSKQGGVWTLLGEQLWRFSSGNRVVVATELPVPATECTALFEDRAGTLWLGTRQAGLFQLAGNHFELAHDGEEEITTLYQDNEGNLWAGTVSKGLMRFRPRVTDLIGLDDGLNSEQINSLSVDATGKLWLVSELRNIQTGTPGAFARLTTAGPPKSITTDVQGNVWLGSWGRGLFGWNQGRSFSLPENEQLPSPNVRALLADPAGGLWIGTEAGLVRKTEKGLETWRTGSETPPLNIHALALDGRNAIWAGTIDGRIARFESGQYRVYTRAEGLPGQEILALFQSDSGELWIGTDGGGLVRFKNGRFTPLTIEHGLWDDVISAILPGLGDQLWFGSNKGVFAVRRSQLNAVADGRMQRVISLVPGSTDGWPPLSCLARSQPSAGVGKDGKLYFGSNRGVIVVDPAVTLETQPQAPVYFEEVLFDGAWSSIPGNGQPIVFPAGRGAVSVRYAAPHFTAPDLLNFRHRLEGIDDDWVENGTRRLISYRALPPGSYTLRVQASNTDGSWQEQRATLGIIIEPQWWASAWFRTGFAVALLFCAGLAWRQHSVQKLRRRLATLEHQQALDRERTRIARDMHDDVGARLTQIALLNDALARDAAAPASQQKLQQVSQNVREAVRAMDQIIWAVNPRNDRLPRLVEFLARFARDYLEPLDIRCRADLPLQVPEQAVAPEPRHQLFLAFKEALQNIAKHSQAHEVWVRVRVDERHLEIELEDDGRGLTNAPGAPDADGLGNMRARLAQIGGEFELRGKSKGVVVRFKVPLGELAGTKK